MTGRNKWTDYLNRNPEKDLIKDLSQEVIGFYGLEVYWINNPYENVDKLFKEDRRPNLKFAKKIVVYPENAGNPISGEIMFSKFGLMNTGQMNLQISVKEWREVFGHDNLRPMEGDLFVLPVIDEFGEEHIFKVSFVDKEMIDGWYDLGQHHTFQVTGERYLYGSENLANIGIESIDEENAQHSNDVAINPTMRKEEWEVNRATQEIADSFVRWNTANPFGVTAKKGNRTK